MQEDGRAYFTRCIRTYCEQIELPKGEICDLHTRKNVLMWMFKRTMTPLEKLICQETEEPASIIHPVWKYGREQLKNEFAQMVTARYGVEIEQAFLFDVQTDSACQAFFHPFVVICSEPIHCFGNANTQEDPLSRSVAKHLRDLLGKGPQGVKVYDLGKYALYRFFGIMTDELRTHMNMSAEAGRYFSHLYSFVLRQAVLKSAESIGCSGLRQFCLEDYSKNEVNILLELNERTNAKVSGGLRQIG